MNMFSHFKDWVSVFGMEYASDIHETLNPKPGTKIFGQK